MPGVTCYRVLGLFENKNDYVDLQPFELSKPNIDQSECRGGPVSGAAC